MASAEPTAKVGWEVKTLEELCQIGDGNHSSKYPKKSEMVEAGVPFIRGTNLVEGRISDNDLLYISEEKHQTLKKGHLKTGDVLFTNRGEIGKVAIVDERFDGANLNSQIAWLRCGEQILEQYLILFLQSDHMKRYFSQTKSGAALQQFTIRMIKSVRICFPPFDEQERIVGILDEAFEGIAAATAQAEKNLHNARELFQSVLQSTFSQKGDDWVEKTLGDCCETTQGVQIPKSQQKTEPCVGFRRYLYISDFEHDRKLKYVKDEHDKKIVSVEDLVVANTGSAGKIYRGIDGVLSNNLFRITVFKDTADKEYLFYFITSPLFIEFQSKIMRGTANPHMGHKNFKSTPINLPPLPTQQAIVEKLDALSEETKRLEAIYERKKAALSELKQSLLQKAFAGAL